MEKSILPIWVLPIIIPLSKTLLIESGVILNVDGPYYFAQKVISSEHVIPEIM